MAVVVGVVCGVAAGIPMSALLMVILNRRDRQAEQPTYGPMNGRYGSYPPVVVIQGGTPASSQAPPPYYPVQAMANEPAQRQFRIVGEHED
jgi:hypothetical protein